MPRLKELARTSHPLGKAFAILRHVSRSVQKLDLNVLAAGMGLYAFLALLPFLGAVAVIYGMFADPEVVQSGVRALLFMAPTRAQDLVADKLSNIIGRWNGGLPALLLGLVLSVYAAARAARSLLAALNLIHGYQPREFLRRWGASLAICFMGGLVTFIALLAIAASGYLSDWLPGGTLAWVLTQTAFWVALASASSTLLAILYRYGPNGPPMGWLEVAPGALAASLLWLVGSLAFSAYVPVFARYDITYGSLAAVVVLQLWLYASAYLLLLGAQLNVTLASASREASAGGAGGA